MRTKPASSGLNDWLLLVVADLNWLHGVGLGARDMLVYYGPLSILSSVREKNEGSKLGTEATCSHWAEVYTAERLDVERICAALPPAVVGGMVNAADVSTGFVRDALLDLSQPNAQEDERPQDPTIWASEADWQELAVVLVNGGFCEPIEFNDTAEVNGRKVLGGLLGSRKLATKLATIAIPQRLIMNIKVSNWAEKCDVGFLFVFTWVVDRKTNFEISCAAGPQSLNPRVEMLTCRQMCRPVDRWNGRFCLSFKIQVVRYSTNFMRSFCVSSVFTMT